MDFPFRIPGTAAPEIMIRRSALGNVSVLVDGQELKRRGPGMRFDIRLPDGTTTELEVLGVWRGLRAKVNGVETALEPGVSPIFVALIFLPLALVVIGGLIGGVIGVLTSMANMFISRRRFAGPLKLAAMVLLLAVGAGSYVGVAFLISPIPSFETGTCVNGVGSDVELTASSYDPVSCATPHDNEVLGAVLYDDDGAYPGDRVLYDFGQQPCFNLFADYVGVDFQASVLDMIVVVPHPLVWQKGDRSLYCIAVGPTGTKLTGSVRDTAR